LLGAVRREPSANDRSARARSCQLAVAVAASDLVGLPVPVVPSGPLDELLLKVLKLLKLLLGF
jgi:hypothetical protein